ncbi:MAG: glycosyltransferase family 2 protein [Candidatus Scalindua sp.]|jgi:polyisoprenyl-phosphate glycosyltransferase|nr:glycosyltransferase family 2 protein [Candidatus Scalindua sp.]
MESKRTSVSVVIPAYNEKDSIKSTIRQVQEVLQDYTYEIIVVDDGSDDGTCELSKDQGAKVVQHPHNIGYGRSIKSGITVTEYDTIVIVDADGTYPIERMPDLIAEYQKGFNMVVGLRTGKHYWESWLKMPLRIILKFLVEFTAGSKIPDINSGLRVFSKKDILPYFSHLCGTFSFSTSVTLAYILDGKFISYIPIKYHKRSGATKVRMLRDSLRTIQYIVQTILYYNPIKLFLCLSVGVLIVSMGLIVASAGFQMPWFFLPGYLGVLTSIVIFSIGLLSDLLRQIMIK